jgi:hypothetical protein
MFGIGVCGGHNLQVPHNAILVFNPQGKIDPISEAEGSFLFPCNLLACMSVLSKQVVFFASL